jgi:hypothetical protein
MYHYISLYQTQHCVLGFKISDHEGSVDILQVYILCHAERYTYSSFVVSRCYSVKNFSFSQSHLLAGYNNKNFVPPVIK